jgi:hypothetical protein
MDPRSLTKAAVQAVGRALKRMVKATPSKESWRFVDYPQGTFVDTLQMEHAARRMLGGFDFQALSRRSQQMEFLHPSGAWVGVLIADRVPQRFGPPSTVSGFSFQTGVLKGMELVRAQNRVRGKVASRFHPYHSYTVTSEDEDEAEADHHGMHDRHT